MKFALIIFSVLFLSAVSVSAQNCKYDKNGLKEPPYVWMQNTLESQTVSKIQGKVLMITKEPIFEAIVSVFSLTGKQANFIGSYETDLKGRFCFGGLKKGKYYIKVGHRNFQRYDMEVNIDPKNSKALKTIKFELDVGY